MFENGYALIIGVDQNLDPQLALETVAKDVTAVHETLIHPERCAYNPDNVKLLSGTESTKDNIFDALIWLTDKVNADDNATAILYYSGHGWVDKANNKYYLIPYDIADRGRLIRYALSAQDFTDLIGEINAKRMLAILDCCHAAGMDVKSIDSTGIGERKAVPAAFPVDLPQTKAIPEYKGTPGAKAVGDLLEGEGRAVLNSSTGSEYSWTRADGRMSLFTYHLIEALTGHSPHDDDDKVVYVTDVMSWVTRQVKKSAASLGVTQTPVMRTSGVFPIAQLIGGEGVATSKGVQPPDPLEHLSTPTAGPVTTFNQEGQTIHGKQYNVGSVEGENVHFGDNIDTGGGAHVSGGVQTSGGDFVGRDKNIYGDEVKGDKFTGDKVAGDKVEGNKFSGISMEGVDRSAVSFGGDATVNNTEGDQISVGDISGSSGIAIGRESQAHVTTTPAQQGGGGPNLAAVFAPLQRRVAEHSSSHVRLVNDLKDQVALGSGASDKSMARLIQELANHVPAVKPAIIATFQHPAVSPFVGPISEFALETLED